MLGVVKHPEYNLRKSMPNSGAGAMVFDAHQKIITFLLLMSRRRSVSDKETQDRLDTMGKKR